MQQNIYVISLCRNQLWNIQRRVLTIFSNDDIASVTIRLVKILHANIVKASQHKYGAYTTRINEGSAGYFLPICKYSLSDVPCSTITRKMYTTYILQCLYGTILLGEDGQACPRKHANGLILCMRPMFTHLYKFVFPLQIRNISHISKPISGMFELIGMHFTW